VHEGGIRVPMIASWPGHIQPGSQTDHLSAFWDVLPTLCEAAGATPPADVDGLSFLPTLLGKSGQRQHDFLYWEYPEAGGQQAVRMGKWKLIRTGLKKGNTKTALYDLEADVREEHDIAAQHPDILAKMESILRASHTPPALDAFKMKALGD
jgi:arylsulfatase